MHGGSAALLSSVSLRAAWRASAVIGIGGMGLVGPGGFHSSMGYRAAPLLSPVGEQQACMSQEEIMALL